jgi:cell fate regulator YaaT (PSP1 superfamily)
MDYLYHVEVAPGVGYECIAEEGLKLVPDDIVIVQCERYQDYATVTVCHDDGPVAPEKMDQLTRETNKGRHVEGHRVPKVIRRATEDDRGKAVENEITSQSMAEQANERIAAHKLDMKLVHTHYSFDRRLVIFQFAAEGRVDFRELLRDLSHTLRTRVELRQVGVRDEAAMRGGIGVCGRAFCCATFLNRFSSISVKMAKVQGLSLNPANISGACGRLKCCLQYEYSQYCEHAKEEKRRRAEAKERAETAQPEEAAPAERTAENERPPRGNRRDSRDGAPRRERDSSRRSDRTGGRSDTSRAGGGGGDSGQNREGKESGPRESAPAGNESGPAGKPAASEGGGDGSARSGNRRRRSRRRGRRGGSGQNSGESGGQRSQGGGAKE